MMTDLSLLSRGCGRLVSSNRNSGRRDGRLDVCFTPQDFYTWKSQESVLHLSEGGRLLMGAEPNIPKTYSTRRGPLLLYSQEQVTMETRHQSEVRMRKQRLARRYARQVNQQLCTLKELTAAILSFSRGQQSFSSRLAPPLLPPLHLPPPPRRQSSKPPPCHSTQRPLCVTPEDEQQRRRVRLDLHLHTPHSPPHSKMEPQHAGPQHAGPQHAGPQHAGPQHAAGPTGGSQGLQVGGSSRDGGRTGSGDVSEGDRQQRTVLPDCVSADRKSVCAGSSAGRPQNTEPEAQPGLLLPPLTSLCEGAQSSESGRLSPGGHVDTWRPSQWSLDGGERHSERHLPTAESHADTSGYTARAQVQQEVQRLTGRGGFQLRANQSRVHQQALVLPPLLPEEEEEEHDKQRGEKTDREVLKKEAGGGGARGGRRGGGGGRGEAGGGGGRSPSEMASLILLQPGEEPGPAVSRSGSGSGRRVPARTWLQNLRAACESKDRGLIRGVLPLELRDLQDQSVGCLILGPDGEIIQLSLYDNSQETAHTEGDRRQTQAVQVLSAEGEEFPWVIVLQPEGAELEVNTAAADIQHSVLHTLSGRFRLAEMSSCSTSRRSDGGDAAAHLTQFVLSERHTASRGDAVLETPRTPERRRSGMPPLMEHVRKEQRGGNTEEAKEERQEERESCLGNTGCLSGSPETVTHEQALQFREEDAPEATVDEAVDQSEGSTKRRDAAAATGKQNPSAESAAQRRRRRKEHRTGSEDQLRQRAVRTDVAERTGGAERTGAAEAEERPAPPSERKKKKRRDDGGGELKMKEEMRQREESAERRKRRRGRLTHKEPAVGKEEEEEEEEAEEESVLTERSPATQKPSRTHSQEDTHTDHQTANDSGQTDDKSTVQSESSLRSSSHFNLRSSRRSAASSYDRTAGLTSSHGRLSSCSTVMVTEEQLMLNPVKAESSRIRKSQEQQEEKEAAALRLAQRAEQRRQEVERKRREREEEEERKQQEKEQTEDRMRSELEEERRKRAEEIRQKRLTEEEEKRRRTDEELERLRREQAQRERERRRQEERRRQMEQLQRMREEEEQRRRAEMERLQVEEQRRLEEEEKKLQEMDESERVAYLHRKEQEEEERRRKDEERRRGEEEAAVWAAEEARLQAELLSRQMALLQQQLAFKRGLMTEAGGLQQSQGISRPWIYSYFTLLQLLGVNQS